MERFQGDKVQVGSERRYKREMQNQGGGCPFSAFLPNPIAQRIFLLNAQKNTKINLVLGPTQAILA